MRAELTVILALVAAAWTTSSCSTRPASPRLHHHALIETGRPLLASVPLFLGAWQVMIGAMMVPAILPALGHVTGVATARLARPHIEVAFLVAFLGVWAGFGLGAFLGDMVVHRIVDRHRGWRLARGLSKPGSWLPPAGTSSHRASAATWSGADGPPITWRWPSGISAPSSASDSNTASPRCVGRSCW